MNVRPDHAEDRFARELAGAMARLRDLGREPNVFIVGAQKSGTTALSAALAVDPRVFVPDIKETNFFARDVAPEAFSGPFRRLVLEDEWAALRRSRSQKLLYAYIRSPDAYASLFVDAAAAVRIDASVTYLHSSVAAELIAEHAPDARIVAVLRDPVDRAFSQYRMQRRAGVETDPDFVSAVRRDFEVPTAVWGQKHLYVETGRYTRQIQRYLDVFPREQVHLAAFETLFADPTGGELNAVRRHVGLEARPADRLPVENAGAAARYPALNALLFRTGIKRAVHRFMPEAVKARAKAVYYDRGALEVTESDRARLASFFAGEAEAIEALVGRSLPWPSRTAI